MYAMNKIRVSSESYLAIPLDVTGYEYYAATYEVNDESKFPILFFDFIQDSTSFAAVCLISWPLW